jgi:diguanylate cyclase (GGDEF)-like protein
MEVQISQAGAQSESIDDLNRQAKEFINSHPEQAARLFEQARDLAQSGEFAGSPYRSGLAASLVGLAMLNTECAKPEIGVRLCLEALALLDDQHPIPATIDAQCTLGWVNLHIADYSTAMDWALKALHNSQMLAMPGKEARALDLIACLYGLMHDFPQAESAHHAALQIAQANQDEKAETSLLNNMAMTLLDAGDYALALEAGLRSLHLSRQYKLAEANAHDTVGQILLAMGDFNQAEAHIREALQIVPELNNNLMKTYLLKNLGRIYLAQNDLSRAEAQIEQALATALLNSYRSEQADCHQLLSTIHERKADLTGALEHFKQFNTLKEIMAGEEAAKQMALIRVIYEVETAKRDSEIHRLRNIELQSEIEERKRLQLSLEKLAMSDPLTDLYNRRCFFDKAEQEFKRTVRYQHPLVVVMLDLDYFKQVNDTYGHAIGDQILVIVANRLKTNLRNIDIVGRIGGEEFALVLPETTLDGGRQTAERIRQAISESMSTSAGPVFVTVSGGVTGLTSSEIPDVPSFEIFLQHADQALYIAKQAGRNQVQIFTTLGDGNAALNPQGGIPNL